MKFKRFPQNDHTQKQNSYLEALQQGSYSSIPSVAKAQSLNFSAPPPLQQRKGRFIAILLAFAILGYGSYSVWNSFLRYDSFGVVDSSKVGVYSPTSGFVSSLSVEEGSRVIKGDVVALVVSTDDQRVLNRIEDELLVAMADLESKKAEVLQVSDNKTDSVFQIKGTLAVEEGLVEELQARVKLAKSEVARLGSLIKIDAASSHEYDTAVSQVQAAQALIASKKRYIESLKTRLKNGEVSLRSQGEGVLVPLERKISLLRNERQRLSEKIAEGTILSPVTGTVASISRGVGEKVTDSPLFTVVVDNTASVVLFYDPSDKIPEVGSTIDVLSLSQGKQIKTKVIAVSKDVTTPPDQIRRNYFMDQKLIKVYLEPLIDDANSLVVGSVIKKPKPQDILLQPIRFVSNLWSQNAMASNEK